MMEKRLKEIIFYLALSILLYRVVTEKYSKFHVNKYLDIILVCSLLFTVILLIYSVIRYIFKTREGMNEKEKKMFENAKKFYTSNAKAYNDMMDRKDFKAYITEISGLHPSMKDYYIGQIKFSKLMLQAKIIELYGKEFEGTMKERRKKEKNAKADIDRWIKNYNDSERMLKFLNEEDGNSSSSSSSGW